MTRETFIKDWLRDIGTALLLCALGWFLYVRGLEAMCDLIRSAQGW